MKKITYLILVSTVVLATTSCKKFLSEDPEGIITENNFYKTQIDAIDGINAIYYSLNSGANANGNTQTPYNILFSTGMDMASDDVDPGPGATNADVRSLSVLAHSSSNQRVFEIWQQHYAAIRKANVALAKIPTISFDANLKNRLLAEAKFLRALYYFNLVRLYGDVPLVTDYSDSKVTAADYAIARTPSTQVYTQIVQDLTDAASVLPVTQTDVGRATKGAALALLAKVYLAQASFPLNINAHYQDAVNAAAQVISGGAYSLQTNYANVFLPAFKNNSEHIFSAQFKSQANYQGNGQTTRAIYTSIPGLVGSYAEQVRFYKNGADNFFSVYKLYKPTDKRKPVTFVIHFKSPTTNKYYGLKINNPAVPGDSTPFFNKWWDPGSQAVTSESAANVPIIRYSEVLLIHAEALNELGQTAQAEISLNAVRTRAGLPNITPGLSQSAFRDSLYLDRRLELVFEYQRWFDLIRQKDASGNPSFVANLHLVGKTNAQDYHRLFPIPQAEINVNPKMTQNPGF